MSKEILISAEPINELHRLARQHAESAIDHAIRCGSLLIEAKASIEHGKWQHWVDTNCEFGERQARRYIQAAKRTLTSELNDMEKLELSREIWGNSGRSVADLDSDPFAWDDPKRPFVW